MRIKLAAALLALAATAFTTHADPRPRTPAPPGPGTRAPNPYAPPAGKAGYWVWTPGAMPGDVGLPWMRDYIRNPIEPGDPAPPDVMGPGGVGGPG